MVGSSLILGSLLAAAATVQAKAAEVNILPGAYIVEYEDNADQAAFMQTIEGQADTRMALDFELFKGVSIKFYNTSTDVDEQTAALQALPPVKKAWPVRLYSVPQYTVHSVAGDVTNSEDADDVLRQAAADTFSPHVMTQVNKLRDEGVVGEGIKVAVIDTGLDYKHPALGGCFGAGCLVSFGTDLVGDAFTGFNTPAPDPDPFDCAGHGTHVAGIVAAQTSNPFGIIGAATGVTLGSFRVFGCDGSSPDDVLISAFNQAYEAGADIITASIGGASGWTEEPWSVAAQRIVENGVPCTISAGNDGTYGLFYVSTAANGKKVTAIASIDNILAPALYSQATYILSDGTNSSFGFTTGSPSAWAGVTLPLWAVNYNTTDTANACDPLPADTPDLSGYIVLIRRGTCTFVQKLTNVAAFGAKYVIFYNNVPTGALAVEGTSVPGIEAVAMVNAAQGATWIAALAAGEMVILAMVDPLTAMKFLDAPANNSTGGFLSTYTSWGPTYEVDFKPQLATPGGLILSTYPTALGSYAVLSGTSMACPLAAGIYALIMQKRGTKDPKTIENLLSATANPNLFNDGDETYPYLAPAAQQGSGLLQAYDAAYATTLLSVSSLSFNDTDYFIPVQNFTVSNEANSSITYTLNNSPAGTGYTLAAGSIFPDTFPNEMVTTGASLSFGPDGNSFTLSAGQRKIVTVAATPPAGLDASRLPVYSGFISINGSDGSSLSLPYIGVAGSLNNATVLDDANTLLTQSGDETQAPVTANHTFVLPPPGLSNETQYENVSYPQLVVSLAMGSALVRVNVVPVQLGGQANTTDVLGLTTIGDVYQTPLEYQPRGAFTETWDGRLGDGTYAPAGVYKMAVRALHIFGDKSDEESYDSTETVSFKIRYLNASTGLPAFKRSVRRQW